MGFFEAIGPFVRESETDTNASATTTRKTTNATTYEDKRMVKFGFLIKEINDRILVSDVVSFKEIKGGYSASAVAHENLQSGIVLRTIYDYKSLNEYGKFIYINAMIKVTTPVLHFRDSVIDCMKDIVSRFNKNSRPSAYIFLFWALMILAVDDTNKEEHLSLICDYAKMLKVTDEEMSDLVNVVKYVFQDKTFEDLKTETVKKYFENVLNIYA